jgi:hypothetical protein
MQFPQHTSRQSTLAANASRSRKRPRRALTTMNEGCETMNDDDDLTVAEMVYQIDDTLEGLCTQINALSSQNIAGEFRQSVYLHALETVNGWQRSRGLPEIPDVFIRPRVAINEGSGTMSGITTDQPERMVAVIRELDSRLWARVLATVINELLATGFADREWLLTFLDEHLTE